VSSEVSQSDPPELQERLQAAISVANVPTLLPVLVQLTGDWRWLEDPYRPKRNKGLDDNTTGGLPEEIQGEIRDAALQAVLAWRAGKPTAIPEPSDDQLVQLLSVAMGEQVPPEYGPLIAAEMGFSHHRVTRHRPNSRRASDFSVIIVGAGASGLAAAYKLDQAGIPHTIIEAHAAVGGTWLENRYPGCGVDTPSALYSFTFAPGDWTRYFALRDELHAYMSDVAVRHGIMDRIRFNTEVQAAAWNEDAQDWSVRVRSGDGAIETLRANVLITAVGAFRKPKWPAIPGLDRFEGPCVHTARWPERLSLAGKHVAVIGNGASGMQLVPAIADEVASLTVLQRSPQWAAPFELFQARVSEPLRFLSRELPLYRGWYRMRSAWTFNDRLHAALQKDPEWPHPERSLNPINDAHREFFTRYIEAELGDRRDLMDKVVPDYPPYGKRILLDNGWYRTLTREHVRLVTERIAEVVGTGVVTESGERIDVDVLVCATGFDVVHFLNSLEVRGRSGRLLEEVWDGDDARAYLGTSVPGFPNLFMAYGPNTQAGHGGSLLGMVESQLDYVVDLLEQMIEGQIGAVECGQEVYERYNDRVDRAHEQMVWTHKGMDTYYRNSRGRVVVNTPWRIVDYWHMTRSADLSDYDILPATRRQATALTGAG
jgi:4-hydroxyacetophenone monooxygenase